MDTHKQPDVHDGDHQYVFDKIKSQHL